MPNCRDGLRYSQYAQVSTIADRNGTGKTTTVRLLCGLDRPDSGTATIDGHPYARLPQPCRRAGVMLGLDAAAAAKRVGHCSPGMRQRLALGIALLGDPGVLVLDEPANGLDPQGVRWIRRLLREHAGLVQRRSHAAVLCATTPTMSSFQPEVAGLVRGLFLHCCVMPSVPMAYGLVRRLRHPLPPGSAPAVLPVRSEPLQEGTDMRKLVAAYTLILALSGVGAGAVAAAAPGAMAAPAAISTHSVTLYGPVLCPSPYYSASRIRIQAWNGEAHDAAISHSGFWYSVTFTQVPPNGVNAYVYVWCGLSYPNGRAAGGIHGLSGPIHINGWFGYEFQYIHPN